MFVVARLIIGLGIPFAIVAASSMIGGGSSILSIKLMNIDLTCAELSHPNERAILGSLFNSCYFIGAHYCDPIKPTNHLTSIPVSFRLNSGRWNNLRDIPDADRLGMAHSFSHSSRPQFVTGHLHVFSPRVSPMVDFQGSRRGGHGNSGQVPRRRRQGI